MESKELTLLEKSQLIDNYKSDLRKLEFQIITIKSAIERLEKEVISAAVPVAAPTKILPEIQPVVSKEVETLVEEAAPVKAHKKRGPKPKEVLETVAAPVVAEASAPKKRGPKPKAQQIMHAVPASEKSMPEKQSKLAKKAVTSESLKEVKKEKAPKSSTPNVEKKSAKSTKTEKLVKAKKSETGTKKKPGRQAEMSFWDTFILNTLATINKPMSVADLQDAMRQERDAKKINEGDTRLSHLLNRSLNKLYNTMKIISREAYSGRGYLYKVKK